MKPDDLKTWRLKHGLNQVELAGLLGVTKTCISRWEAGKRPISPFLHLALGCLKVKKGGKTKGMKMKKGKGKEVNKHGKK